MSKYKSVEDHAKGIREQSKKYGFPVRIKKEKGKKAK